MAPRFTPCLLALLVLAAPDAAAQDRASLKGDSDDRNVHEQIDEIRREVQSLKARTQDVYGDKARRAQAQARAQSGSADLTGSGGNKGGIYDKPFLRNATPTVQVGGYFDVEFRDEENQNHEFRFHRFIPFFYATIHERIRFASEVEIEDGTDVAIEFAFLEVDVIPQANFRGGVILDPLGKFNLIHDSPINDLTDRPLVNRFVIPTTFREVGLGLFGTLSPNDWSWEITYEAYATSGFKGLANDGSTGFSNSSGVRGGRAHGTAVGTSRFDDVDNKFSGVGRLAISPVIGSEFGLSAHSGTYDEMADNNLTITAVDALYTVPQFTIADVPVGPVEFQGEGAYAFVERDALARASGIPGDMWGYYAQMNYHFMPQCLTRNAPAIFFPNSTFTFVTRWGQVDLDGFKRQRLTVGLNYRPVESTVFKLSYQFNNGSGTAAGTTDDDAFVVSLATFF